MTELERYRRALQNITDYKLLVHDEWDEAEAFRKCQRIAGDALDPCAKRARLRNEREADLALRKKVNSLEKQRSYFLVDSRADSSGYWVRFLHGDDTEVGIVHLMVLGPSGKPWSNRRPGEIATAHVSNLRISPSVELGG